MKFYDQIKCVKCTALISKSIPICPICGRDQGAAVTSRPPAARTTAPPSVSPRLNSSPQPTPAKYYVPPTSCSKKTSDAPLIVGGIVVLGAFVAFLVASTHHAALPISPQTTAISAGSADPSASADVARENVTVPKLATLTQPQSGDSSRVPGIARGLGVIAYCQASNFDVALLNSSLNDLTSEINEISSNPQLLDDASRKARLTHAADQVGKAASAVENIPVVPAECAAVNQKLQQVAALCDRSAHREADAVVNGNREEMLNSADEMEKGIPLFEEIAKDEDNLKARYSNAE